MPQDRKYLAFDIETAKDIPNFEEGWRVHRPLGIACAAAWPEDLDKPILWHGRTAGGAPAPRMSREEAGALVEQLADFVSRGYTLLTWNGLGFDLDVLCEESGRGDHCRDLAMHHVDMMFHIFCDRGFPVSLQSAAQGMGVRGKPEGLSGMLAPKLWAQGRHQDVLNYVGDDVRIALEIARAAEKRRRFDWITRKGTRSSMQLPGGWLAVGDAMRLPLPDTSWMPRPLSRGQFTAWLTSPSRKA